MKAIKETHFNLPDQTSFYRGKVRDVYTIANQLMVMVVSDRISAFDVVLPRPIPFKGQVLNQIAAKSFKLEMVIRGYLCGHLWREYKEGKRTVCGEMLPKGLKENDKLPEPIITPTTKASVGHDENVSRGEIIERKIVSEEDYSKLENYAQALFKRGTEIAAKQGLILADTKYEFGKLGDQIILIDEIHTPDSSRYFYSASYQELQNENKPQKQLSKEFVREWLMENGFQGKDGQQVPEMTDELVNSISERYIELFKHITGEPFIFPVEGDILLRIENNIIESLKKIR